MEYLYIFVVLKLNIMSTYTITQSMKENLQEQAHSDLHFEKLTYEQYELKMKSIEDDSSLDGQTIEHKILN